MILNRKNVLFAAHDEGAENWASVASLVEACKLNDVDPQTYFADVLDKLVNLWPVASRSRPCLDSSSATTANTSATERSTCSLSSTCIARGAGSKSPTAAPPWTSPPACANSVMSTSQKAERIRVVLDNLSTHSAGALYQAFPAGEARRMLRRLEFHYTPKHASWLNMVEIEIGVLRSQCLDRRIATKARLIAEVAAWERHRNASGARIQWMFTTYKLEPKWAGPIPTPTSHNYRAAVRVTKYRYPVLGGDVGVRCRELLRETARAHEMAVHAGSINRDHVHMLLSIPPSLSVSRAVQHLKGRSSRKLLSEFGVLRKRYWGQHL